ncbi:MAG: F0F1 ATP synthase subunit epsilon [Candidatus Omnitrophica bacterium]|nr:F0F1 ATP synthase subunit epsilon [Candidatus Omnitrophota bacterium]
MLKAFQVGIYSSDKIIYEGEAVSLVAPSESGYLGILASHAPLVAKLKCGVITFKDNAGLARSIETKQAGYLEVLRNNITILLK